MWHNCQRIEAVCLECRWEEIVHDKTKLMIMTSTCGDPAYIHT